MNHVIVLLLCSLLLPGSVQGFRRIRYLDILKEHQEAESSSPLPHHVVNDSDMTETEANDVQELYFTQRLDHYDPSNTNMYRQRYFYTSRYTMPNAENTVTLLCVGGEGPGFDTSVLVDSAHCSGDMLQVASVLFKVYHWNVHVYALEHRYYGKSYPTFDQGTATSSPVATQNLKYLSSRQALEDLAHFVRSMSKLQQKQQQQKQHESPSHGSSSSSRYPNHAWITFGGSYPGYLASLARLKYPHLVHAAVSNSAPLELKVDFPEYLDKLGSDLRYEKIGGSQLCFDIVKNGHYQAVQLLQDNATRQALAQQFNVCKATTALDDRSNQNLFVGDGLIGIDVQDNDPSCTHDLCNVEKLCGAMVKMFQSTNQTELEILADIARQQRGNGTKMYDEDDDGNSSKNGDNCVDVDWKATLMALSEPKVTNGGWRSWLWQTCTEVGFYQTCQHETCPYASFYHLVDMDLEICQAAYNITPSQVYSNIQASLDHYGDVTTFAGGHGNQCSSVGGGEVASSGGWRRVLTVHGDVDPWGVLGLQPPASTRDMPVKMVEGASHHFWTHAVHETDAPEIERIREYIVMVVLEWLNIDTTTTVSVVDPEHDPDKDDGVPQNS